MQVWVKWNEVFFLKFSFDFLVCHVGVVGMCGWNRFIMFKVV